MKTKNLLLKVALSTVLSLSAVAYTQTQYDTAAKVLKGTPSAELPAKAGAHVAKASKKNRKEVAIATTRAAIEQNRGAARLIVAAIVRVAPESADVVAATASSIVPAERGFINFAAITAAEQAVSRNSRVAVPTEGNLSQNDNPINTTNRSQVGTNGTTNSQNSFQTGTNANPEKVTNAVPAPGNYQRHN